MSSPGDFAMKVLVFVQALPVTERQRSGYVSLLVPYIVTLSYRLPMKTANGHFNTHYVGMVLCCHHMETHPEIFQAAIAIVHVDRK